MHAFFRQVARLDANRAAVTAALQAVAARFRHKANELRLTHGEVRVATASATRRVKTLATTHGKHLGPVAARDLAVSERVDRPVVCGGSFRVSYFCGLITCCCLQVRVFAGGRSLPVSHVAAGELSERTSRVLTEELQTAAGDHARLTSSLGNLDGAMRDCVASATVTEAIVREREKFAPHRRT
jgi:hypothetical protein